MFTCQRRWQTNRHSSGSWALMVQLTNQATPEKSFKLIEDLTKESFRFSLRTVTEKNSARNVRHADAMVLSSPFVGTNR